MFIMVSCYVVLCNTVVGALIPRMIKDGSWTAGEQGAVWVALPAFVQARNAVTVSQALNTRAAAM